MNHYSIYWIKDEFACHFFYKSGILYRFLKTYQNNKMREDLTKQYHYITNEFPKASLISYVTQQQSSNTNLSRKDNQIEISRNMQYISLHIHQKHLNFRSEILHDAEELLFPALRLFQPSLFIAGNNVDDYGWISPVIRKEKDKSEQVLYSYQ